MKIDYDLITDLSLSLNPGEKKYIFIRGYISTIALGVKIVTAGGAVKIQSSLASTELFEEISSHSEVEWENIKVDGVEYSEVTFDIPSMIFYAPNILYIENTSINSSVINVDLRGNRS